MAPLWPVSAEEIELLAIGAWILSTGGGGSPYLALLNMRALYRNGAGLSLMDPMDLADERSQSAANISPRRRRGRPVRGLRPGSITCRTQTPAAPGADATAGLWRSLFDSPEAEARVEFLVDGQIEEGIERILALRRRGDRLRRPWEEAGRACHES